MSEENTISSKQPKLTADQRLTAKKLDGLIPITSEEVNATLRDKDLRQAHEKTALLRLAQQFFASGGRSLEQVAYDTVAEQERSRLNVNDLLNPTTVSTTKPLQFDLNMVYSHHHTFTPNTSTKSSLQEQLADAEKALLNRRPGTLVAIDKTGFPQYTTNTTSVPTFGTNNEEESSLPPKKKARLGGPRVSKYTRQHGVFLPKYNFRCFLGDLPDPPNITYSKNYRDLTNDWKNPDSASAIVYNEGRVPLCAWIEIYKNNKPQVWETLKIRWRNWRLIVACYEAHNQSWFDIERKYGRAESGKFEIPSMTYLLAAINKEKKGRNTADVEKAKSFFTNEEFGSRFVHSKRGSPMVKVEQIAYHWRNIAGPVEGPDAPELAWWDRIATYTGTNCEEE